MKKLLVFAVIAMVAGSVMAQTLSWIGDSGIYYVEGDTWYNASGNWGSGGAFNGVDFGLVSSLTLGCQASTLWDDDGTHPTSIVYMAFRVDDLDWWHSVNLPWLDFNATPNEDRWRTMLGMDVVADFGPLTPGVHTVAVCFSADNYVWDNNGGANYTATFQTIPEPATMSLLGLGALAMVLRRKIRK